MRGTSRPPRGGFRPRALAPCRGPLPSARRRSGLRRALAGPVPVPAPWLRLSGRGRARRSGGSCPPSPSLRPALRLGPARAGCARLVGCARPPRRCGLRCARPWAAAGSRRPPWAARPGPGPPLRRPAGAALRLPSRLPPGGLWRGCAPLSQAPGPPAFCGVRVAPLRRRCTRTAVGSRVKPGRFAALDPATALVRTVTKGGKPPNWAT